MLIVIRIDIVKTQIFQMILHAGDTQPVGDRRIDHQSLFRNTFLLVRRQGIECQHIVQSVTQFDDQDTDILDRCDKHFSKTECRVDQPFIRGRRNQFFVTDLYNLGQPFHQMGDILSE